MAFSNLAKKNLPVYSIKLEDFCRKLSIVSLFMLFCLLYLMFYNKLISNVCRVQLASHLLVNVDNHEVIQSFFAT